MNRNTLSMNIQQHTSVWIACLLFSWKCGQVSGSETIMTTWKQAVLDCYGNNSFLESNISILKNYMLNHTKVNSIWIGSFEALLPWIEIRGCYNIPLACKSSDIDEKIARNLQLCQLKCTERRYFAFNQQYERCVCFDKHDLVEKETDNASFCQECKYRGDCNTYAVVYKVFDRPISVAGKDQDCLSYQCDSNNAMPVFATKECYLYCRSYCRDGQRADGPAYMYQHFFQYRSTCEDDHFTYPLLHSGNPVKLCNLSQSHQQGIDIWVGVYRQRLYMDTSDKAVLQELEQYISHCNYLSTNGDLMRTENCSDKRYFKCTSATPMDYQKESNKSSTSTPFCRFEDPDTGDTDNQSSGIIAGTVTSMLIVVVVVTVVFIYRRRFNSKIPKLKDKPNEGYPPKINTYTQEKNSDGYYNAIDITLGPNSFAKPLADNNTHVQKAAEDEHAYSRIVSTVFAASNFTEKTNHAISNRGYNDLQIKVDAKTNQNGNQQISNSLTDNMNSADYCQAKPITHLDDMDPYIDNADYDHLSSCKTQEKNSVNVYDHVQNIIDSDDTYDHSAINICESESTNYDHFDGQN